MTFDNHFADAGEKEYEDRHSCPNCHKGSLTDIDWCDNDHYECTSDCDSFSTNLDCPYKVVKLICDRCETVM